MCRRSLQFLIMLERAPGPSSVYSAGQRWLITALTVSSTGLEQRCFQRPSTFSPSGLSKLYPRTNKTSTCSRSWRQQKLLSSIKAQTRSFGPHKNRSPWSISSSCVERRLTRRKRSVLQSKLQNFSCHKMPSKMRRTWRMTLLRSLCRISTSMRGLRKNCC